MKQCLIACFLFVTSHIWATPRQIFIIRHGEKPPNGNMLNQQGFERSGALAFFFNSEVNPTLLQLGGVTAIFAQKSGKKSTSSIRPVQTVTPLGKALGLKVLSPYRRDEVQHLADLILNDHTYNGGIIVICWSHQMIAALAQALGAINPPAYPENSFDLIYTLTYDQLGNVAFCVNLQELMFEDSTTLPAGFPSCP